MKLKKSWSLLNLLEKSSELCVAVVSLDESIKELDEGWIASPGSNDKKLKKETQDDRNKR